MKKDNKLTKFVVFVLLITLLALILVSNTYAKYTTSQDLNATATVAKWSVKVNNSAMEEETTIDLFKHSNSKVKSDKIAPGTTGSFDIELKNESEVAAECKIEFDEIQNGSNIPLEFSLNNQDWQKDISKLEKSVTLGMSDSDNNANITIYWRWAFEGKDSENFQVDQTDPKDTALGTAATTESVPTAKVTAHLTATQAK